MGKVDEKSVENIVKMILDDYEDDRSINRTDLWNQPDKNAIIDIVDKLLKIMYPGYFSDKVYRIYSIKNTMGAIIEDVIFNLKKQIANVLRYGNSHTDLSYDKIDELAQHITMQFMERIPLIREYLDTDLTAAIEGDPAAYSKDEVILSYPGFYAISVYRIAHELWELKVPLLPRIMSEHAHGKTGIDIHPGATIGKYFFIDHGTGVVVGETTIIGEHVKMYQGVTLGGLSTKGGQALQGKKRHPTIMDNVTIYSGASILGGETVIGENVVVGGNAFVTSSIERGSRVVGSKSNTSLEKNTIVDNMEITFSFGSGI